MTTSRSDWYSAWRAAKSGVIDKSPLCFEARCILMRSYGDFLERELSELLENFKAMKRGPDERIPF